MQVGLHIANQSSSQEENAPHLQPSMVTLLPLPTNTALPSREEVLVCRTLQLVMMTEAPGCTRKATPWGAVRLARTCTALHEAC